MSRCLYHPCLQAQIELAVMGGGVLESLRYKGPSRNGSKHGATLQVLDQLLLPREKAYMDVRGVQDTWKVGCQRLSQACVVG
eukprot:54659-Eustigmatos_ZCMA.PRE.1